MVAFPGLEAKQGALGNGFPFEDLCCVPGFLHMPYLFRAYSNTTGWMISTLIFRKQKLRPREVAFLKLTQQLSKDTGAQPRPFLSILPSTPTAPWSLESNWKASPVATPQPHTCPILPPAPSQVHGLSLDVAGGLAELTHQQCHLVLPWLQWWVSGLG